jgi:molybdopterin synthase sulfur carrier subunit
VKVKVLYFSSVKDKLKKQLEELEIKENATVEELINVLQKKYPEAKDNFLNAMIAVNEEYKDKNYTLKNNDVVAIIPPVSGG